MLCVKVFALKTFLQFSSASVRLVMINRTQINIDVTKSIYHMYSFDATVVEQWLLSENVMSLSPNYQLGLMVRSTDPNHS